MPQPPFQNDPRSQDLPPGHTLRAQTGSYTVYGSPAVLLVTRPEEILPALSQHRPVLIDIPTVQWRLSLLATIGKYGGKLAWWFISLVLAPWLLTSWLDAQLPNKDYLVPDWAKFHFQRQPDNKVIIIPIEE
jgi:hypothetical protein